MKNVKAVSLILILLGLGIKLYFYILNSYDISVQNKIIDNVFNFEVDTSYVSTDIFSYQNKYSDNLYLGYIYIPRFNIKRLIKSGTDDSVLNSGYVGMHSLSGGLDNDDLIILAGHNISNVFGMLHSISIGDYVYINTNRLKRKFIVYDSKVVDEYDSGYLFDNHTNELLLITCTKKSGERLIVFLREVL